MKYYCECCKYDAKVKSSFEKHLRTKKHAESIKSHHLVTPKSPFSHPKVTIIQDTQMTPFQCHYCLKTFKYKQGMYRHIKYTCKKNKDEDFKELARLLNEKDKQIEKKDKQIEKMQLTMQKQIDKLTQKLQIQNVVHGDVNNQNNILVFDEATSSLDYDTENEIMKTVENLKDKTIIIVAHRLTSLRNCDRILKLQNGEIISHENPKEFL